MNIRHSEARTAQRPAREIWALPLALSVLWLGAGRAQAAPRSEPGAIRPGSVRYFDDPDGPKARLSDGREYPLLPLSAAQKRQAEEDARRARERKPRTQSTPTTPPHVDNRRFHGPIRAQGQRRTCTSFATAAALEGMYRRLDPGRFADLELSPQYINHFQKMVERAPTGQAAQMEDQLGCWGGSPVQYATAVMERYGVAEEATMPYNPMASFEQIDSDLLDAQRNPRTDAPQIKADQFNLDPAHLPIAALEHAPYRPTKVVWLTDPRTQTDYTRSTDYLEQWVAAGYDIAFGLTLVDDASTGATALDGDGAWIPGDGRPAGGHAMLIVGYDRPHQYFIVRNEWGTGPEADANDGGYTDISYDYIQQYAHDGAVITEVADPQQDTAERLWIRDWSAPDGSHLDIYRLPETYSHQDPRTNDYRIGTWFTSDGTAYRVNGRENGENLEIAIDPNRPDLEPDALSGNRYVLQLNPDHQGFQVIDQGPWQSPVSSGGGQGPAPGTRDCGRGGRC
jgi:papain like protease